ncbi:putative transcription factor TGA like domain-containing protein [Helianthus debilis subsp. tardiflorus]
MYITTFINACKKIINMDNLCVVIVAFETMYDLWVFEQRKRDNELKTMLQNQVSEPDLCISVDSSLNHYYELFQMKANAMKADVFYFMYGMWRKPIIKETNFWTRVIH